MAATVINYEKGFKPLNAQALSGEERMVEITFGVTGDQSYSIKLQDRVIRMPTRAVGEYVLYLPPVSMAAGLEFAIHYSTAQGSVRLHDLDDSWDFESTGSYLFDADKDSLLLKSDGRKWWELVNAIA